MLLPVSDLFKRAYAPYHKFPKLVASFIVLMCLPVLFLGIAKFSFDLIGLVYGVVSTNALLLLIGSVIIFVLSLWFTLAYILAVADINNGASPQKISAYLKKSRVFIFSAIGLIFLVSVIVASGFILLIISKILFGIGGPLFGIFSLVVVIPLCIILGILFNIWLMFFLQARVLDQKKGLNALSYSKSLVKGNWWGVFGRVILSALLVFLLMSVIGSILGAIFQVDLNNFTFQKLTIITFSLTVLISIIQAIFTPFASAIPTILYLDLKRSKSATSNPLEPPMA